MENEHLHDVDYEQVSHLLNIVKECAGHDGKLGHISDAAMSGLMALNKKIAKAAAQKKKDEAEAKAAADAEQAAATKEPEPIDMNGDPPKTVARRDFLQPAGTPGNV